MNNNNSFLMYALKRSKNYLLNNLNYYYSGINSSKPNVFIFVFTKKCNFRCTHCDIWKEKNFGDEISLDDWKKAATNIFNWVGPFIASITGGEAFLRKDLFEFADFLKDKCIELKLNTNGSLINERIAKRLSKSPFKTFIFSLYSLSNHTNDKLRGIKGSYKKTLRAINLMNKYCEKYGFKKKMCIAVLITKYNLLELSKIVIWAKTMNVKVILQPLLKNFDTDFESDWIDRSKLWPNDRELIHQIFKEIIHMKKNGFPISNDISQLEMMKNYYLRNKEEVLKHKCKVGVDNITIYQDGNIKFCSLANNIGNIKNNSISKIWKSITAKEERQTLFDCKKDCRVHPCYYDKPLKAKINGFISEYKN
ncbi:MAG: radical SAM protein [DPANN group archaeon]|nr:radical SAM protein [DPANN group archaeon]